MPDPRRGDLHGADPARARAGGAAGPRGGGANHVRAPPRLSRDPQGHGGDPDRGAPGAHRLGRLLSQARLGPAQAHRGGERHGGTPPCGAAPDPDRWCGAVPGARGAEPSRAGGEARRARRHHRPRQGCLSDGPPPSHGHPHRTLQPCTHSEEGPRSGPGAGARHPADRRQSGSREAPGLAGSLGLGRGPPGGHLLSPVQRRLPARFRHRPGQEGAPAVPGEGDLPRQPEGRREEDLLAQAGAPRQRDAGRDQSLPGGASRLLRLRRVR